MDSTPVRSGDSPKWLAFRYTGWPIGVQPSLNLIIPALLAALGLFCLGVVDAPAGRWLDRDPLPRVMSKLLDAAEHFGTPFGQVLIVVLIAALEPEHRRRVVRLLTAAWGAGLAADLCKFLVARRRPKYFDFTALGNSHGFQGLFPWGAGGSRLQSFPSAHTASAVGFCVALSHFYPRGRAVFIALAVMVGLQRMETTSHFASDVCAGALVGWVVGRLCSTGRCGERFDHFEAASR